MSGQLPEDDDLRAAELALGLIDGDERAEAERRLATDAEFAAAHARWQARALAIAAADDEAPRPSLWQAIVASLPANDDVPTGGPTSRRVWRAVAGAVALAAVLLLVVLGPRPRLFAPPSPAAPAQTLVATLTGDAAGSLVTVSVGVDGGLVAIPTGLALADRAAELWVIPAGGAPRSLGVIDQAGPSRPHRTPAASLIAPGATLAISKEPPGGSPSGAPTGPVILTGVIRAI